MNSEIPAVYTDKHGPIHTTIQNDSEVLTIELDGTTFTGRDFLSFEPENAGPLSERFTLGKYDMLTDYKLSCQIPISTWKGTSQLSGILLLEVDRNEKLFDGYNYPYFHFSFKLDNEIIEIGALGQFEGVFEVLGKKLPAGIIVKTCYTCMYADYSVAGNDLFGSMLCFRNIKDAYLKVTNKGEYMDIMDSFDRFVQETYVCGDFTVRTKGAGYRG